MSSKKREEPAGVDEVGPGQAYLPFVVMEDLLDKLKLINYDTEFTTQFKIKPISRHYFAVPTNPGEQFYIFSSLAAWLIQQAGIEFETPQESDDPNTTISNILDVLRNMGTAIDFPPSRLKQGWGEHVIFVLDHLADKALRKKHFAWKTLLPPEEQLEEEAVVDDAAEVTLEKIEEEMMEEQAADDEDDDDGPVMDLDGLRTLSAGRLGGSSHLNKPEDILQSTVDSAEWKLEVERVLPQLRVTVQPDAKITEELEQIKQEMEERGSSMTDGTPLVNIRKALTRLKTEITQMDVRIGVAVHTLLQAKIKEKGNLRDVADAPAASYDSVY
ncbi:intraflagellar transport protein 57 homolog isoform X3 [Dermacentor andersoni]|uniref:intraflagellar transport protein 57 homolog isoform X3 n=1 Tax=Dermacentor andersoni TaxID=34620 RepID=UPI002416BC4A|nr:intraflagellar transport protein 57 homolog isoform X3 [Dermacentor andersoni]